MVSGKTAGSGNAVKIASGGLSAGIKWVAERKWRAKRRERTALSMRMRAASMRMRAALKFNSIQQGQGGSKLFALRAPAKPRVSEEIETTAVADAEDICYNHDEIHQRFTALAYVNPHERCDKSKTRGSAR